MNKDRISGIVGLIFCMFFAWQTTIIRKVPNAVEPGPKMMPILAISIITFCSIALILTNKPNQKPYFPPDGIKK